MALAHELGILTADGEGDAFSIYLAGGVHTVIGWLEAHGNDTVATAAWVVAEAGKYRAAQVDLAKELQLFDAVGEPDFMLVTLAGGVALIRRRIAVHGLVLTAEWVVAEAGKHRAAQVDLAKELQLFDAVGEPDFMLVTLAGGVALIRRRIAVHGLVLTAAWVVAEAGKHRAAQVDLAKELQLFDTAGKPDFSRIKEAGGVALIRRRIAVYGLVLTAAWVRAAHGRHMNASWKRRHAELAELVHRIPGSTILTLTFCSYDLALVRSFLANNDPGKTLKWLEDGPRSCFSPDCWLLSRLYRALLLATFSLYRGTLAQVPATLNGRRRL
jgi:hypothetical protein